MNGIARFFMICLIPGAAFAQSADAARHPSSRWTADQRLTFHAGDSQTSINFARSLAAGPAGAVQAVWFDTRDGLPQIYTKRSADGGATWGPDVRLSQLATRSEFPAVALSGRLAYV